MGIDDKTKEKFIQIGKHIKFLREKRNLSIKDVSLKTGIRTRYLRKIENGTAYGVLLEKHLCKIANTFDVSISKLFNY